MFLEILKEGILKFYRNKNNRKIKKIKMIIKIKKLIKLAVLNDHVFKIMIKIISIIIIFRSKLLKKIRLLLNKIKVTKIKKKFF